MKKILVSILFLLAFGVFAWSQEAFDITHYQVHVKVNNDASMDIVEQINVHFLEPRHGLYRKIPFKYQIEALPSGTEKAHRQMESAGYTTTIVMDIAVDDWDFSTSTQGDYKELKIGSKKMLVDGDQQFVIRYKILNAINFFSDHSELYFNLIGNGWETGIAKVDYTIELANGLPAIPEFFVASGVMGSKENNTTSQWSDDHRIFTGSTTTPLSYHEGVTVGMKFPKDFLTEPNFFYYGVKWILLAVIVFVLMFFIWNRWGKDEKLTIQTEFYPPKDMSPSVAGYVIDDKLDKRDLTALVPYWGAGGYLQIKEIESSGFLGIGGKTEYEFIKLKNLPDTALTFERTLFDGIFLSGDTVLLSSLKNVLYVTMKSAKDALEAQVDRDAYYTKNSRGLGMLFVLLGIIVGIYSIFHFITTWGEPFWYGLSFLLCAPSLIGFGAQMAKKTEKGNELYQKLAGFKEFIKTVEQDKLKEFLQQDQNYIDKVLPFAIVFDVADAWKDKLKGLDIPPPNWYSGNYATFNTYLFLNSLDHSMNQMSESFYSAPSSSGTSGGSWSSGGGGGFSGGGFGGGGGGSW